MKNNTRTKSVDKKQVKKVVKITSPHPPKSLLFENIEKTDKNESRIKDFTALRESLNKLRFNEDLEKYRNMLENIQDGCFETDLSGNLTFLNDAVCRALGYSREELMSMNVRQLSDKESLKKVFEATNEIYRTGKPVKEFAWQAIKKDGATRYIKGSISLRKDLSGNHAGFLIIANDISEHKRIEDKLHHNEQLFRALVERSSDIIVLLNVEGIITYINPAVEKVLGFKPEERIGAKGFDRTHPDDLERLSNQFKILATDTNNPFMQGDLRLKHKDGIYRTFEAVASNLVNNNVVEAIVVNYRDITERKWIEEELCKSEEKYRTVLENMKEGYFEVDLGGNFTFFNDPVFQIIGYPREELMSMNYRKYTDEETAKKIFKTFNEVYQKERPVTEFGWHITRKDGENRYIEISTSLQKDLTGKPIGYCGILRDITERKQAEEKLHQTLNSLRKAVGTTIQVLIYALEIRDPYTAGHQTRSADLAYAIAKEMKLAENKIEEIRMAGVIHDIGKMSVPVEILSKPTKLTDIEFFLIKDHPRSGYDILKNVESPWSLAEIVYQHHERINGTGYPRNLKGNNILLAARILAVADVVEAMSSHRPYRPALGIHAALEEIKKNKGILYDGVVVDTCLKLFQEKGYRLKEDGEKNIILVPISQDGLDLTVS